jgi:hypothetical protein
MAHHDPKQDRQDPNVEEPGDTNSADIVGRTGEQMPKQDNDGIDPDDASLATDDEKPETDKVSSTRKSPIGVSH